MENWGGEDISPITKKEELWLGRWERWGTNTVKEGSPRKKESEWGGGEGFILKDEGHGSISDCSGIDVNITI